jgi:hypothetical protein
MSKNQGSKNPSGTPVPDMNVALRLYVAKRRAVRAAILAGTYQNEDGE